MPAESDNTVGRDRMVTIPVPRRYVENLTAVFPGESGSVYLRTFSGETIRTFAGTPIELFD
jgi:hypothetical protein